MTCADSRRVIGAFLDGETDPATSAEVERHLKECASCSGEEAALRSLREALRRPELSFRAPSRLAEFVGSAAASRPGALPRARRGGLSWMGIAASFAAGALLAGGLAWRSLRAASRERVAPELFSAHIRSLLPNHLVDVTSSDQHTVKPWFAGKLDYSPPVVDLADKGFPLLGGRLDAVGGRPVAVLVYRRRQHLIDLFILPRGRSREAAPESSALNGYRLVGGSAAGMDFWAVSDLDAAGLAEFARLLSSSVAAGDPR